MNYKQEELRQKLEALFATAPKQIVKAVLFAIALGFLLFVHAIFTALSSGTFSGNTIFYSLIMFFVFLTNALSLARQSRFGYIIIAVFALLPMLGSLAGAVHLLALIVGGNIAANLFDTISSAVALLQCVTIAALLYCLLQSASRSYIWKIPPEKVLA